MRSGLEEIPRADIEPLRFGIVEDVRTGRLFRQRRDGLIDLDWTSRPGARRQMSSPR
jgi:hypothetical protein